MSIHDDSESPDALTSKEIEILRKRLVAERERILGLTSDMSAVRETRERSAEPMDEAQASLEQHEALGKAAHDRTLLQLVDRALKKIESGMYGVSERSGEPLGFPRLQAVPWARFTAGEQEELEDRSRQHSR